MSLTRRGFLTLGGAAVSAVALSGCGSSIASSFTGSQPNTADVIFWHLFGGGDGANMTTMVDRFEAASGTSVEATLLSWGNPYYTKLALSTSSGRPPDVAVAHLSRLPLLARAGLLQPVGQQFASAGITKDQFTPAAWSKATVDGTTYAVPLDTHPFVLYYNVPLARKAGLLDGSGELASMSNADDFVAAITAMKRAGGGDFGAIATITADPSTCWRLFSMTYAGLAGPVVSDGGTRISVDQAAMTETFAFLQSLTGSLGLMPSTATATTTSSLFSQSRVGFCFDGVWQIPTYRSTTGADGKPLDFSVVPFPALLGSQPKAYADSHSLVLPANPSGDASRTRDAVAFVRGLLDESVTWAGGGHVPAWLPVQRSAAFQKLEPQSHYVQAAFDAVYDPEAWYTGAGSDFQTAMGSVIAAVLNGSTKPADGTAEMITSLRRFANARPPV